ncbi:MAG: hypothetical protein ABIF77_18085 [bacterium]
MVDDDRPTERQNDFAKELGIKIKHGMTRTQVSELISEALVRRNPPSEGNLRSAKDLGIDLPRPMPKKEMFDHIWSTLNAKGRTEDMAAFFTYRVCRGFVEGGKDHPLANGVKAPAIREIAKGIASNDKAMASIKRYEGRQLIRFGRWTTPQGFEVEGGSKRTMGYKAVKQLISTQLGLADPKDMTQRPNGRAKSTSSGCLGVVAVFIVLMLVGALIL